MTTSSLNNPLRFALRNRTVDVDKFLGSKRNVTEIEILDGQIYVHWEEDE